MNTMTSNRHNMIREVQLLNRLNHTNILKFMGVCVHEGQLHALTEYIPGGSLEQLLANKEEELPWTQRIQLTLGLAQGLDYLHCRGYIHRDLTSKNILIKKEDSHGYCGVLADFGLATKIPNPLSHEKLPTVGSPYWMAPEVLNGQFYNEKADLFSVGIIMCEITARISADPDVMPRMNNFGVDYVALSEMIVYCPLDYLQLAFKCCQVDQQKRPLGKEIIEWLEKIFRNLQNDIFTRLQKEKKSERNGHKRSRSEDNILQVNDNEADTSTEDIIITPLLIGQVMSRDDPCYVPSSTNPFASIQRFQHGRKLLGTSMDFAAELPSPSSLVSPPSTPACLGQKGRDGLDGMQERKCQSLPSSPVLLRRAAERNHLESLHGSARYCNLHYMKGVPVGRARSKSTVFSDAFAHRLHAELALCLPQSESLSITHIPECHQEGATEEPVDQNSNNSSVPLVNGCCQGISAQDMPPDMYLPSTATRRRMMRRLKYQSLDGDIVGVPQIYPLPKIASGNNKNVAVNGNQAEKRASPGNSVPCVSGDITKDSKDETNGAPISFDTGIFPVPHTAILKPPIRGGVRSTKGHSLASEGPGDAPQSHRHLANGSAQQGRTVAMNNNNWKQTDGSCSAKQNDRASVANTRSNFSETKL